MTLEELLDITASNFLDDRAELVEGPPDELWDDFLITRYLQAGQEIFCRKAWPIVDDTTAACCSITLLLDTKFYPLHKSVVRVLSVTPADTDIPLVNIDFNLISPQPFLLLPDYYQVAPLAFIEQSGRPGWYSVDNATRILRLRPAPDAKAISDIGTLKLRVARLPIVSLNIKTPQVGPEIPDEFHLDLCSYAAGRCLMQANVDSDVKDEGRKFIDDFYIKLKAARNDRLVAQFAPGMFLPSGGTRTLRY